jgi:inorganic pyrophosphatase
MTNYLELPVGPNSPEVINAVIEIPVRGHQQVRVRQGAPRLPSRPQPLLARPLPRRLRLHPQHPGDDGDPLDCLVLVDAPSFPGCVMEVRPIGLLEMLDQGLGDEKVLCVGKGNPRYKDVWNFSEIYPHMLKEITHFFAIYKDLEGKRVEVKGWRDAAFARTKVTEAQQRFIDNKTNPEPKPVPKVENPERRGR